MIDPIRKRAKAYAEHGTPGLAAPRDRAELLAIVDAQQAQLDAMSDTNSTSSATDVVLIEDEEHTQDSCTDERVGICRECWSLGDPA